MSVEMGGERVERQVETIGSAATWVEAWLLPRLDASGTTPAAVDTEPMPGASPPVRDRGPGVPATVRAGVSPPSRGHVALIAAPALGDDGSVWAGAELSARLMLARSAWLGAALGVTWDAGVSGPASESPDTTRHGFSAAARGGAAVRLGPKVAAMPGVGAGVTTGIATRDFGAAVDDTDQGGVFVEAIADVAFELTGHLTLLAGAGARYRFLSARDMEDAFDLQVPPALPAFTGELRLGAGYDFGGAP